MTDKNQPEISASAESVSPLFAIGEELENGLRDQNEEQVVCAAIGLFLHIANSFDRIATALETQTKFIVNSINKSLEPTKED